ncbi:MAG TPA: ABC transporter permease [Candidatus Dojkabacteria bacterium]|nr:ABC transporter permease [Candidatus Dojkabacteria bacterium]
MYSEYNNTTIQQYNNTMMKNDIVIKKYSNFRGLIALTRATIITSLRNPTSLFFNFFFPFIFIVIFGILGQGDIKYSVALRNDSLKEGILYEVIKEIDVIDLIELTDEEIDDQLKKGQISTAITIKKVEDIGLSQNQVMERFELEIDSSLASPEYASTISTILNKVVQDINNPTISDEMKLVVVDETYVEGRKYEQIDFILPGQLAFALFSNAIFGLSFSFFSMRKNLIIKRIFATPISKWSIVGAEVIGRLIISVLQTLLIVVLGHYMFGFYLAYGVITVIQILALAIVGSIVFLGFGFLVSCISKTEDSISPIANLVLMPQLFLSGAFFSIDFFPKFLQPIANNLPMTFLNNSFKMIAFEGVSFNEVLFPELLGLLVWGIVVYIGVVKTFKWE